MGKVAQLGSIAIDKIRMRFKYPSYKSYVGPPDKYDAIGQCQVDLFCRCGLRPEHSLLDIGCGSLRAGRLFINYLQPGHYFGMEPNDWLVKRGIRHELGEAVLRARCPTFNYDGDFNLSLFGKQFDFLDAHSIFTHASKSQISKCFAEARKVMKATSLLLSTYNLGERDYAGDEWVYPGSVEFRFETLDDLSRQHGLRCTKVFFPHPASADWLMTYDERNRGRVAELLEQLRAFQKS